MATQTSHNSLGHAQSSVFPMLPCGGNTCYSDQLGYAHWEIKWTMRGLKDQHNFLKVFPGFELPLNCPAGGQGAQDFHGPLMVHSAWARYGQGMGKQQTLLPESRRDIACPRLSVPLLRAGPPTDFMGDVQAG
ncbi:hypothetical protein ElyMa_000823200 [Elysia marginata]|uniref:Uncharacterized protein n=1 Tax=Elysia marginata TaxID=1093978 RepID=A0AAV4GXI6_9GAST|nr:hypothetical protein ElyMa_000823200 [Elysia marginata]